MTTERHIALCAIVADTPDEEAAMAVLFAFARKAGFGFSNVSWQPYRKNGDHSMVRFYALLPPTASIQAVADAVEAMLAAAVDDEGRRKGYCNTHFEDDGSLFYNRILDDRTTALLIDGLLWLDIEVTTHPEAQADFRAKVVPPGR